MAISVRNLLYLGLWFRAFLGVAFSQRPLKPPDPSPFPLCSHSVCHMNAYCASLTDGSQHCRCNDSYVDVSPTDETGFVCLPIESTGCNQDFYSIKGSPACFRLFSVEGGVDRNLAQERCQQEHSAHLASVFTREEAELIYQLIRKLKVTGKNMTSWLGLRHDFAKNTWYWTDQLPIKAVVLQENLNVRHELGEAFTRDCMAATVYTNGWQQWNDYECDAMLDSYICRVPRKGFSALLDDINKLYPDPTDTAWRSYTIVCCAGGYPAPNDNVLSKVLHFSEQVQGNASYGENCVRYTGHFSISLETYKQMQISDTDVRCKCPESRYELDRNCMHLPQCKNSGYRSYSINLRCSCPPQYFGELCEYYCYKGTLEKVNGITDECRCYPLFEGRECNMAQCLNGGAPHPSGRCQCTEEYTGQHCEIQQAGRAVYYADSGRSVTNYLTSIGVSFFVLAAMAGAVYFFVMKQRRRRLLGRRHHAAEIDRGGSLPNIDGVGRASLPTLSSQQNDILPSYFMHMGSLPPPPAYTDIYKYEVVGTPTGSAPPLPGGAIAQLGEAGNSSVQTATLPQYSERDTTANDVAAMPVLPLARQEENGSQLFAQNTVDDDNVMTSSGQSMSDSSASGDDTPSSESQTPASMSPTRTRSQDMSRHPPHLVGDPNETIV